MQMQHVCHYILSLQAMWFFGKTHVSRSAIFQETGFLPALDAVS